MMGLWYDEAELGQSFTLGSYEFTRDNILSFARRYDPQPFHIDDAAAEASPYGALIASGFHTAAAWMKCFVAANQAAAKLREEQGHAVPAPGPSPGFTDMKWLRPIKPGDIVAYSVAITGKRELVSRPAWGLVMSRSEGRNQRGELVFSFEGKVLVARR